MQCHFCKREHEGFATCKEGKAELRRLKEKQKKRRYKDMHEPSVWPRPEHVVRQWSAYGLECAVARGTSNFCGYVKVPKNHPDARRYYEKVDVRVHGGLTFQCKDQDGGTWFGFDTAHAGDVLEMFEIMGLTQMFGNRTWNSQDVMIETQKLALGLSEHVRRKRP